MASFVQDGNNEYKEGSIATASPSPTVHPPSPSPSPLPAVLILGGCGFVGRNLVHHLVTEELAAFIKVADKARPEVTYFHEKYHEAFQSPIVQYEQDDLTKYVAATITATVTVTATATITVTVTVTITATITVTVTVTITVTAVAVTVTATATAPRCFFIIPFPIVYCV